MIYLILLIWNGNCLPSESNRHLSPSNQKFVNRHREYIKSQIDKDVSLKDIGKHLGVKDWYLSYVIERDNVLKNAIKEKENRTYKTILQNRQKKQEKAIKKKFININDIDWRKITGHEGYYVSRYGEVVSYRRSYDKYQIIKPQKNVRSGYIYVGVDSCENRKLIALHRLVAIYFVEGRTEEKNTVNHKDGNKENNVWTNLEWVSQSENNKHSYDTLHRPINYGKRYKDIIVDNKYHFKTITALAKFLGISWTQANRYITKECKCSRKIEVIT